MKAALVLKTMANWILFVAQLCFASSALAGVLRLGDPAPPLNLAEVLQAPKDANTTWESLRGKVVVLDFWATWCGPCVASIPHWNELSQKFRDQPVVFLAISDE